jgi:atypical dual specificity phosphatase
MCKEYRGPTRQYEKLGMKELWLPTVDHFEPSVEDLKVCLYDIVAGICWIACLLMFTS